MCFACSAHAAPPKVRLEYSERRDWLCSLLPSNSIKDEWREELLSRQEELIDLWERHGRRLVAATEAVSGKVFASREVTVRLTLCSSPSESFPLSDRITINMRYALKSFTRAPVSVRYKMHTLFHELLHLFLFQHPMEKSALVEAHAAEHERVRSHLHLLAVQKAVLIRLDERDALREIVASDSALPGGHYKRAWEIVNATEEEYLKYVAELAK